MAIHKPYQMDDGRMWFFAARKQRACEGNTICITINHHTVATTIQQCSLSRSEEKERESSKEMRQQKQSKHKIMWNTTTGHKLVVAVDTHF